MGFHRHLVEALCDTGLSLLFYILLGVVRKELALLALFLRLIGTAGFAMAQVFYFAALPIVGNANQLEPFPPDQLHALAMLSLNVSGYGQSVFTMFYGVGSLLVGYLVYRSDFLPKFIGILLRPSLALGSRPAPLHGSWRRRTHLLSCSCRRPSPS